ncbi:hypothetical protein AbraIFM66950_004792 [Aspergillus brasiliensis]|nr:hypothetical protein AbraIFM66950_004792 [Aspergillus brasiliensis]
MSSTRLIQYMSRGSMLSVLRNSLPSISIDGILLHATLFISILIFNLGGWRSLLNFILATFAAILALAPLGLIGFLVLVSFGPRGIESLSKHRQTVIGKPMLFPITLDHTRLSPIRNKFIFDVLFVGVPVGLSCRIGRLLSIDAEETNQEERTEGSSVLNSLGSYFSSWLSFDSVRYLHRGDDTLSLQDKLHKFLREQNEDPAEWPYAYMLSVPRFLWWERSVVTWWYLYSRSMELDTVIMEINNSFDEKRNVLYKVQRTKANVGSTEGDIQQTSGVKEEYIDVDKRVCSLTPQRETYAYKAHWKKEIFASPFEKVGEAIISTFMDPVAPASWSENRSLSNTTTLSPSGTPKMIARLWCKVPPIDPSQASALEHFFREYLRHCVASYPDDLEVTYIPCKSVSETNSTIRSRQGSESKDAMRLTVQPMDPGFYTRIANSPNARIAMAKETEAGRSAADMLASPVLASDIPLLLKLFDVEDKENKDHNEACSRLSSFIFWLRRWLTPSFMDVFVCNFLQPRTQDDYVSDLIQLWVEKLTWNYLNTQQIYSLVKAAPLQWAICWIILRVV